MDQSSLSGLTVWIAGVSGAGKTSLGREIWKRAWQGSGHRPVLLDGDDLRTALHQNMGHDFDDRVRVGQRNIALANLLAQQGHLVILCSVGLNATLYEHAESVMPHLQHIVLLPDDDLLGLDGKGLYAAARTGRMTNLVGIDIEVAYPSGSHLALRNSLNISLAELADTAWAYLLERGAHLALEQLSIGDRLVSTPRISREA